MPASRKMRRWALLSLVGDTLLFLSLPLNYTTTTTTYSAMPGLGEHDTSRQWTASQTTWNHFAGPLLDPSAGIVGPGMVAALVLFLLSLPTLSVLCLVRPASKRLSATGTAVSGFWLLIWFIAACNDTSSSGVSFGSITTLADPGPGLFLVPVGLVVATFSMVALHRRVREQLYWQHGTAANGTP
jgi:hypothetical protein